MSDRSYRKVLLAIAVAGLLVRVGYVLALRGHDPAWDRPSLDGAYYVEWARALAGPGEAPGGAYYLAPLYPHLLAIFFHLVGERFLVLFMAQEALLVATAVLLATVGRRVAGPIAGVATAALVLLYHPATFFAARPIGEILGLVALASALAAVARPSCWGSPVGSALAALGALARPNLLLVPVLWAATDAVSRRWRDAILAAATAAAVIAPVALRNAIVSGHLVPVSSNGGITLFHGNGPGATGIFTPPRGLSGRVDTQRDEATALARVRSGRDLDPVEADAWWGREAVRARLADPAGTLRVLRWRLLLLVDSYEHGLDAAPALDENPWRRATPVPLGILLGLAACGCVLGGFRRTGGSATWWALVACALAPVVFYASSRYRLPAAVVLCVPAGAGAARLVDVVTGSAAPWRGLLAAACGAGVAWISLVVPSAALAHSSESVALANLAAALEKGGDLEGAERTARRGIERDPEQGAARFVLGVVLGKTGREVEAEAAYREVLARDPGHAGAAANLARLLVERSRPEEAIAVLRVALRESPVDALCWNNLVVALALAGRRDEAAAAWRDASGRGVAMDPDLLRAVEGPRP